MHEEVKNPGEHAKRDIMLFNANMAHFSNFGNFFSVNGEAW